MSQIAQVEIFDVGEKLPPDGIMILADIGGEWEILMADGTNTAYAWEQDGALEDGGGLPFYRWASLGQLTNPKPVEMTNSPEYKQAHENPDAYGE